MAANDLDAIISATNAPAWVTDPVNGDLGGDFSTFIGSSGPPAVAGYPAVTVAAGFVGPLPIDVTFMGGRWSEGTLLAYAYDFEQATHARVPPRLIPSIGAGDPSAAAKPEGPRLPRTGGGGSPPRSPTAPSEQRLDQSAGQRPVEVFADPALVVGARLVGGRRQPTAAGLRHDVEQLRDDHREVARRLDAAGAPGGRIRVAQLARPHEVVIGVLDEHGGELARRVGEAGIVEVEHAQSAVLRAAHVVRPEIAMTGPQRAWRLAQEGLEFQQLRHHGLELRCERRAMSAERCRRAGASAAPRPGRRTTGPRRRCP